MEWLFIGYLAVVSKVVDGDTLQVTSLSNTGKVETVRLARIDAPELKQEYGEESKQALSDLCFGATVDVKVVRSSKDPYGRKIAEVFLDDRNLSDAQLVDGNAWRFEKYARKDVISTYLQYHAQKRGHGLWGASPAPVAPWNFRKEKDCKK